MSTITAFIQNEMLTSQIACLIMEVRIENVVLVEVNEVIVIVIINWYHKGGTN